MPFPGSEFNTTPVMAPSTESMAAPVGVRPNSDKGWLSINRIIHKSEIAVAVAAPALIAACRLRNVNHCLNLAISKQASGT